MFITPNEASAVIRLVNECREVGDDALVWRQHFFAGLARLVGADLALGGEMAGCLGGTLTSPGTLAWGFEQGYNMAGWQVLMEWFAKDPFIPVTFREFITALRKSHATSLTTARQQLITDRDWYRSPDYQAAMRIMGTDALQHSFCQIPDTENEFSGVLLQREEGRPQFDEHEVALVDLAHREITRLIGTALARWDEPLPSKVPRRARQVLRCLLEGDGDKQVAARLKMSSHTVNHYTKLIYRHFGVASRSELLARWVRRGWGSAAAWDDARVMKIDIPRR